MTCNKQTSDIKTKVTKKHVDDALDNFYSRDHESKGLMDRMRIVLETFLKNELEN